MRENLLVRIVALNRLDIADKRGLRRRGKHRIVVAWQPRYLVLDYYRGGSKFRSLTLAMTLAMGHNLALVQKLALEFSSLMFYLFIL